MKLAERPQTPRDVAQQPGVPTRSVSSTTQLVIVTYRIGADSLRALVRSRSNLWRHGDYESVRMPDSSGFGDPELARSFRCASVEPTARFRRAITCTRCTGTTTRRSPGPGDRGFPKKLAKPKMSHQSETIVCTLHFGTVLCVSATMGYKHRELDPAPGSCGPRQAEFHDQDHSPRRLHAAHLRAGALLLQRRHAEGRMDWAGCDRALRTRAVRRGAATFARSCLGQPLSD